MANAVQNTALKTKASNAIARPVNSKLFGKLEGEMMATLAAMAKKPEIGAVIDIEYAEHEELTRRGETIPAEPLHYVEATVTGIIGGPLKFKKADVYIVRYAKKATSNGQAAKATTMAW